jgi:hypothetical protein
MSSAERVNELHEQAMKLAEQAVALNRGAADREEQAAFGAEDEPTRSVLYRSAAWLALAADQPARAARLAQEGQRPETPAEILIELQDVERRARGKQPLTPACVREAIITALNATPHGRLDGGYIQAASFTIFVKALHKQLA